MPVDAEVVASIRSCINENKQPTVMRIVSFRMEAKVTPKGGMGFRYAEVLAVYSTPSDEMEENHVPILKYYLASELDEREEKAWKPFTVERVAQVGKIHTSHVSA